MSSLAWKVLAALAMLLAALAAALPILPAIPFLLLAALAAERGWPGLGRRLAAHPVVGPLLAAWKERRAIPRSAKLAGLAGLAFSAALAWIWPDPVWLPICIDFALLGVAAWVWTRPVV